MKTMVRSKVFWVCLFFLAVGLLAKCVFDTSGVDCGLSISTEPLPPNGCKGQPYQFEFVGECGTPPYTFKVNYGQEPPGLTLASDGTLKGTPTQNGVYHFEVELTDKDMTNYWEDFTISIQDFNITNAGTLITYCPGVALDFTITTCGGTPKFTWSLKAGSGSLPAGISLTQAGHISGKTAASGEHAFTVVVKDSAGKSAEKEFTLSSSSALYIATASPLPDGQTATTYKPYALQACGGNGPYSWDDPSGSLPSGLTLGQKTGTITGTPTQAGNFTVAVEVQDSASTPAKATKSFALKILASGLAISTSSSLTDAAECKSYSSTLTGSGGTGKYAWTLAAGSQLPKGLSLNATLGTITGIPTVPSSTPYSFVTDLSDGKSTVSQTFTLRVIEDPASSSQLVLPEVRHTPGDPNNTVRLSGTTKVKVDFRFTSTSYLSNVSSPAKLQVLGECATISTTDIAGPQDFNSDGQMEKTARFDTQPVVNLLTSAGKNKAGDTATLRLYVDVLIDTKTQTFIQTIKVTIIS